MLKYLALILLIANIALWGWSKGWFGEDPSLKGRDPQKIHQQIRPQTVTIAPEATVHLPPSASNDIASVQASQPLCIETGPLDNAQAIQFQQFLGAKYPDLI